MVNGDCMIGAVATLFFLVFFFGVVKLLQTVDLGHLAQKRCWTMKW